MTMLNGLTSLVAVLVVLDQLWVTSPKYLNRGKDSNVASHTIQNSWKPEELDSHYLICRSKHGGHDCVIKSFDSYRYFLPESPKAILRDQL